MKSPDRRKPDKNAQRHRFRLHLVGAFTFQNIFFQETLKSFLPKITVEDLLTLDGISNEVFHNPGMTTKVSVLKFSAFIFKGVRSTFK